MAAQNRKKKKGRAQPGQKTNQRSPFIYALLAGVFLTVVIVGMLSSKKTGIDSTTNSADNPSAVPKNDSAGKQRELLNLVGRWIRTDGGYVIEIRNIGPDGRMDAGYYNPRPINVSVAEASLRDTGTTVFMELRDAGYPGSTYTLDYDPSADLLTGVYYQAAMQQNFEVVFARMK